MLLSPGSHCSGNHAHCEQVRSSAFVLPSQLPSDSVFGPVERSPHLAGLFVARAVFESVLIFIAWGDCFFCDFGPELVGRKWVCL